MKKKSMIFVLFIVVLLTGCRKEASGDGRPIVYTSFYPIQELVESISGDTVDLRTFLPATQDPHLWEPTPKNMKELSKADLLIVNGANMEKWVDQVRDNLPELKVLVLSEGVDLITYKGAAAIGDFQYMSRADQTKDKTYSLRFGHTHENLMRVAFFKAKGEKEKDLIEKGKQIMEQKGKVVRQEDTVAVEEGVVYAIEMGHESGVVHYNLPEDGEWIFVSDRLSEDLLSYDLLDENGDALEKETVLEGSTSSLDKITYDPHSWLSVNNAKQYILAIYKELAERYPEYQRQYAKNRTAILKQMTEIEYEYEKKFQQRRVDEFVVTHNAYGYLARDFGLRQFPLTDLVSTESPSLKTIKTAISYCKAYDVDTIFYEYGTEDKSATTLAEELNGEAVPLISMEHTGNIRNLEENDYISIMRYNLDRLYEAVQ